MWKGSNPQGAFTGNYLYEQVVPRDPDAAWGCKGDKTVKLPDGKTEKRPEYFFGYKTPVSLNQKTGLVTSLYSSTGKEPGTRYFRPLMELDRDKGYDDGENFMYLQHPDRAIVPAIRLRKTRLECKSKKGREYWETMVNHPWYKKALNLRNKIEQKFGIVRRWYRFARCRSRGLGPYAIQAYMTFLVYNVKRVMQLVEGQKRREKFSQP